MLKRTLSIRNKPEGQTFESEDTTEENSSEGDNWSEETEGGTLLVFLEGPHGVGKSTTMEGLRGIYPKAALVSEGFLNLYTHGFPLRTVVMQMKGLVGKMEDIIDQHIRYYYQQENPRIIIVDRGFLTPRIYHNDEVFGKLNITLKQELHNRIPNLKIKSIIIEANPDLLWNRIKKRYKKESSALSTKRRILEDNRNFLERICDSYRKYKWDHHLWVYNQTTKEELLMEVKNQIDKWIKEF